VSHFVTSADSDYFIGECPHDCYPDKLPCISCVEAQRQFEHAERLRVALVGAYFKHHQQWPQSSYIDDVVATFNEHKP
jgi:hypothetical protein